jgi:two-component system nitrogen regulation response regulator GlnG
VEPKRLSDEAVAYLARLDLPGNVRQLENLCNWITVMAPGQMVEVKDLPRDVAHETAAPAAMATSAPMAIEASRAPAAAPPAADGWTGLLELQAANMLSAGGHELMDVLGRQFESALIKAALKFTHGRKNDAAQRLGIGRNTITRKIAELGIDGASDEA